MCVWLYAVLMIALLLGTNGCTEDMKIKSVSPQDPKLKHYLKITMLPPLSVTETDCWHPGPNAPREFKEQMILANQGNATAQYRVGTLYYTGNGVQVNNTMAAVYFKMAADQGLAKAQYRLGECYMYGTGVGIDRKIALHYFQLAGDQGDEKSQFLYEYNGGNSTRYGYIERGRKNHGTLQVRNESSSVTTGSSAKGTLKASTVAAGGLRSNIGVSTPNKPDSFVHGYTIAFAVIIGLLFVRLVWYCLRRQVAKL